MEISQFDYKVYDNVIEITLREPTEENTVYEFTFEEIVSATRKHKAKGETIAVTTAMTPMYTTISSVKGLLHERMIDNSTILISIRDASRFVEYITGEFYLSGKVPYAAAQYVKYRAAYESILKKYSETAELAGHKGQIGKVSFESKMPDLKPLLDELKDQMLKWELELKGGNRARFSTAIKGIGTKQQLGGMPNSFSRGAMDYGMARPRYTKYY